MDWEKVVIKNCKSINAEPTYIGDEHTLAIVCAEEPTDGFMRALRSVVPNELNLKCLVGTKPSTQSMIQELINSIQPARTSKGISYKGRHLWASLDGIPADDSFWEDLSKLLRNDGFFKSWTYIIDGVEYLIDPKIVFSTVKRDTQFTDDDMMNLRISLENAQTIDDILAAL
jgi:hypothetical protein